MTSTRGTFARTQLRGLEIGPGKRPRLNTDKVQWDVMDIVPRGKDSIIAEWGCELPFDDDTYDIIYASHVLEHIPWFQTVGALREAWRVLKKPSGTIELWVPDFAGIVAAYHRQVCGDDWRKHNIGNDFMTWVNGRLYAAGPEPNWHRATFDAGHLARCLWQAGFCQIVRLPPRKNGGHGPCELGMTAKKWKG